MANEQLRAAHPRRAGIGDALRRAIPMPDDAEAQDERHLCRRIDHRKAVE